MQTQTDNKLSFEQFKKQILDDFRLAAMSREVSILGRREVLTGKAKFGIFGDGKELPQIAMAKVFKNGDFRSGYYRDQTLMYEYVEYSISAYFELFNYSNDIHNDTYSSDC